MKKFLLLLSVMAGTTLTLEAQKCATAETYRADKQRHPEILKYEQQLEKDIRAQLLKMDLRQYMKTTGAADSDTVMINIPVVVHVIHDYGNEYVSDNAIYQMVKEMNIAYNALNTAELAQVIAPFQPYIGNVRVHFYLATKDPQGNPTHGITRRRSYLTQGGDNQAKYDLWAPSSYMNIWLENHIGLSLGVGTVLAYATPPASAAANVYYDGVISDSRFITSQPGANYTIPHEAGHYFNLKHPWDSSNQGAGQACGDDDVDDTPPTTGHFSTCPLYDTTCAHGYVKNGIDYPDTANTQNIMDYSSCALMFTKGQAARMRAALRSAVASRINLWNDTNLYATGVRTALSAGSPFVSWPDLAPVADFSVSRVGGTISDRLSADKVYGCADGNVSFTFTDRSWRDTVASRSWTFGNGATTATSTGASVTNKFTQPGWVSVSLTANSNAGSNTVTRDAIYVADPNATDANGYFQEFSDGSKDQWPSFNFFGNNTKWEQVSNTGYYDQYSVRYKNYDNRTGAATLIGTPQGDYDDMFSPVFNLSGSQYTSNCNLNFYSSGGFRTTNSAEMTDSLEIWYSIDCGNNWSRIKSLTKGELANLGTITYELTPQWLGDWKLQSIPIPAQAKTGKTMFRFRYKPGVFTNNTLSTYLMGSGNNFYMDRINISSFPTGIDNTVLEQQGGMVLAPNPTTGSTVLTISGGKGVAQVLVTDVTGKVVYRTQQQLNGAVSGIDIPAGPISVKGMYLVQVIMENKTQTQKLVVY